MAFQQQQIKASALNALSQSGVVNPDQAFSLLKENLRLKDGVPIALAGGVEVPLQQHLESLRTPGSGWEHHFSGSGARGMSAAGSSSSSNGQKSWASMALMERIKLEEETAVAGRPAESGGLIRQPLNLKNHGRLRLRQELGHNPRLSFVYRRRRSATRLATSGSFSVILTEQIVETPR